MLEETKSKAAGWAAPPRSTEVRSAALPRELSLHLGLIALVLALTWAAYQSGSPVRMPAILSVPGLASGLNNVEDSERGPFRWTNGAATLCAVQAGRAARGVAEVTLAGDYALGLGTATAALRLNDGPPLPIALAPGLRRYRLLGGEPQPGPDLCVHVDSPAVRDPNKTATSACRSTA